MARNEWWREAEPEYIGESDGQEIPVVYIRKLDNGDFEYTLLRWSDGEGPGHIYGGYSLCGGILTEIPGDN